MSLNSGANRAARCHTRLARAALMLALILTQPSRSCLAKDNHESEGGREIIEAVLLTCYERDVEGLTILESKFAGKDVGLGELVESEEPVAPGGKAEKVTQPTPRRTRITPHTQKDHSMLPRGDSYFKNTRPLVNPGPWVGFDEVLPVVSFTGPLLSMKKYYSDIRIGDIVRVEPVKESGSPLIMFYAGEQDMEGISSSQLTDLTDGENKGKSKKAKQSFFVYPYIDGVEWNTFPPRQHRDLRDYLLEHKSKTKTKRPKTLLDRIGAFFSSLFSSPPPKESALKYVPDSLRGVLWLKTPLDANHCGIFHKDKTWAKRTSSDEELTFRFRVLRLHKSCEFTTLKNRFPRYNQEDPDATCWWAANTQVRLYQAFAKNKAILSPELIRYHERRLLTEELVHPTEPDARQAADFYREFVYEVQNRGKAPKDIVPRKNNALAEQFRKHEMIGFWAKVCYLTPRRDAWKLQYVKKYTDLVNATPDDVFDLLTNEIEKDSPVIVRSLRGGSGVGNTAPWRGYRKRNLSPPSPGSANNAGHAFVVTGTRKCGDGKYVHFAWNDGRVYFCTIAEFYSVTVALYHDEKLSEYYKLYQMPDDWVVGDSRHVIGNNQEVSRVWGAPFLRVTR